jgi:hypothetical protein
MSDARKLTFLTSVRGVRIAKAEPAPYSKEKDWLLALADRFAGPVRRAFLQAIEHAKGSVVLSDIEKLLAAGKTLEALTALGIERAMNVALRGSFVSALSRLIEEAGQTELARLPSRAFVGPRPPFVEIQGLFNVRNPYAINFLKNYEAGLITNVSRDTSRNVAAIVRQAFQEGGGPAAQARRIRDVVGLLPQQAAALARYEQALRAGKVPKSHLNMRVERYAKKLLTQRATVIARTETIRAANAGQDMAWKASTGAGMLPPGQKRQWLVTRDDRLCPSCAAIPGMNKEGRALDEPFRSPEGAVMAPPLHPNCRCAMSLKIVVPD